MRKPLGSRVGAQLGKGLYAAIRELRRFAYRRSIPAGEGPQPLRRPRLGLALGGGFARGIAHVGVLKVLVENQIAIDALAGISSGSIAAAAFASGCTIEEMTRAARKLRWSKFARWTIPRLGFATNERMDLLLSEILDCQTFEQLKLPLAVVAGDIRSGEAVTFREGDLKMPVRASCSFPGLFVPIEYNGRLLVDGVVAGSVPVAALRGMDVIVAVNVQSNGFLQQPRSLFEVVGESFHIAQNLAQSTWRDQCDLAIEPKLEDFSWDDFERTDELIAAGETAARKALPALRNLLRERAAQLATQAERLPSNLALPPAKNSPVPTWSSRATRPEVAQRGESATRRDAERWPEVDAFNAGEAGLGLR
jgi:NTE family protein